MNYNFHSVTVRYKPAIFLSSVLLVDTFDLLAQTNSQTYYGKLALQESVIHMSERSRQTSLLEQICTPVFYIPAFRYNEVQNADKYKKYKID